MNQSPISASAKPVLLSAAITRLLVDVLPALVFACLLCLPARAADSATVTFTFDFPNSSPEHYSITVEKDGHSHYESVGKIADDSDDRQTYQTDFEFSDATRVRIFDLAAQAHYFTGKVDSGNKKLAFTGSKKLAYHDAQRSSTADYNFSSVPAVQQLTTLFQNVSATMEFGRRLVYFHRFQKLALDDELTHMEDEARRGEIIELQAVKPILQQIYDDETVMNIDRARALRIMDMVPSPTADK
jgi:hypothetical protein